MKPKKKIEAPPAPPPPPPPPEPAAPAPATPAEAPSPLAWVLVSGTRGRIHLAALREYYVGRGGTQRAKIEVWEHKPFTDDDGVFSRGKTVAASEILPAPPADDDRRLKAARSLWERRKPLMERK